MAVFCLMPQHAYTSRSCKEMSLQLEFVRGMTALYRNEASSIQK